MLLLTAAYTSRDMDNFGVMMVYNLLVTGADEYLMLNPCYSQDQLPSFKLGSR
jgi:hypothetical protein